MTDPYVKYQKEIEAVVLQAASLRAKLYQRLRIYSNDTPKEVERKMHETAALVHEWARNPVQYIEDVAWAPDPRQEFGARAVPQDLVRRKLLPARAVPIILWPAQKKFVERFFEALDSPRRASMVVMASRQVIKTTLAVWCLKNCWDYRGTFNAGMTTYDEKLVDVGGKEQRSEDSLFGRFRLFNDYVATCFPSLRYNLHQKPPRPVKGSRHHVRRNWEKWVSNVSGLNESEDVSGKLVRGKLYLAGNRTAELFPEAVGNLVISGTPGDNCFRGQSLTVALLDEFGQIANMRGGDMDRKSVAACAPTTKMKLLTGTLPENGGHGTLFNELAFDRQDSPVLYRHFVNWTQVAPYRVGGWWHCDHCKARNEQDVSIPYPDVRALQCSDCGETTVLQLSDCNLGVEKFSCIWWDDHKMNTPDRNALAREYLMDPGGAQGDKFFYTFEPSNVKPVGRVKSRIIVDGFDPGYSSSNPGAWISVEFDTTTMRPILRGYHMAANKHILWWVPFFKRWRLHELKRQVVSYGHHDAQPWLHAYHYDDGALAMLERVGRRDERGMLLHPPATQGGSIEGDKYGGHKHMMESPYDLMLDYGLVVNAPYTADREALVRKGLYWAARLVIDSAIADVRPLDPKGHGYPSILSVFLTAKPRTSEGETRVKLDVSKREPAHVSHPADAWFYVCRALPETVHSSVTPGGWQTDPLRPVHCSEPSEVGGIW